MLKEKMIKKYFGWHTSQDAGYIKERISNYKLMKILIQIFWGVLLFVSILFDDRALHFLVIICFCVWMVFSLFIFIKGLKDGYKIIDNDLYYNCNFKKHIITLNKIPAIYLSKTIYISMYGIEEIKTKYSLNNKNEICLFINVLDYIPKAEEKTSNYQIKNSIYGFPIDDKKAESFLYSYRGNVFIPKELFDNHNELIETICNKYELKEINII